MKVKVVKCRNSVYWYNNMIGRVFDVKLFDKLDYSVIDWRNYIDEKDERNGTCGLRIFIEDTIEVKEEDNMQNLLLELCELEYFKKSCDEFKERISNYPMLVEKLEKEKQKNKLLLERLHQCKKSHRENKCKLMGKIYKILRKCK